MRKPRSDSKLKTLPLVKQQQIAKWGEGLSLEETVEWIAKDYHLTVSISTVSEFLTWWAIGRKMEEYASFADEVKNTLRDMPDINLSEDQLSMAAQAAFEVRAVKSDDSKLFVALRTLRQRDAQLELEKGKLAQRVSEMERKNQEAKAALEGVKTKGGLTEETIREIEQAVKLL